MASWGLGTDVLHASGRFHEIVGVAGANHLQVVRIPGGASPSCPAAPGARAAS